MSFLWALMLVLGAFLTVGVRAESNTPMLRIETGMHTATIWRIGVDDANRYLVTASEDKTVRVWNATTGIALRVLRPPSSGGDEGKLYTVSISPDGRTVACGGATGQSGGIFHLYVFDRDTGELIKCVNEFSSDITGCRYSPDGRFLAVTLGRGGICLYRTSDYSQVAEDSDYGAGSYQAAFANVRNALRLVTSCDDGFLRLYDVNAATGAMTLRAKTKGPGGSDPMGLSFSPGDGKIAVGYIDTPQVSVLSGDDLSPLFAPDTTGVNQGNLGAISWSADGRFLYAGGIFAPAGKSLIRKWSNGGHGSYVDIAAANTTIMDLQPRLAGGIFFGAAEPTWGLVDGQNQASTLGSPVIAQFLGNFDGFCLSPNASTVSFSYLPAGQSPATFSTSDRKLTLGAVSTGLRAPVTVVKDLNIQGWKNSTDVSVNGQPLILKPYEMARSLAIAPDHDSFLLGTEWYLRLYNKSGIEQWEAAAPGSAWTVNISTDGKVAVAAFGDGTIRWFQMTDGKELLAFFPHPDQKRWIAWTPAGQYDCSAGAENLIGWQVNRAIDEAADFYPVSRFFDEYYTPHLLAHVLNGDVLTPPTVTVADGFKTPPTVQILSPRTSQATDSDSMNVTVQATDQGGGIENLRLYLNDKLVADDQKRIVETAADTRTQTRTFIVTLVPGQNTIRAVASSHEHVDSSPVLLDLELQTAQAKSDLYILSAGIENYKNPAFALSYCDSDAQAFATVLENRGQTIFGAVHSIVLTDRQVTKSGLEDAFAKIQGQAKPTDVFVFYYSGHGNMPKVPEGESEDFYLVCQDVLYLDGADGITKKGLSAQRLRELSAQIKAQKQLLVLDACQSGGAIGAFSKGLAEETAIAQLAHSAGVMVLAASLKQQAAQVLEPLKHSVFTYALLQGLSGDADRPPDGKVTVSKLNTYLNDQLPILTHQYGGETQYPSSYAAGQDFPIGVH